MPKAPTIDALLRQGSAEWNRLRKAGKVAQDHTGATFSQLFSANADLSGLSLVGTEWEGCDLSKINFREADLSNAYFHGGRLQDCDFRGANLAGATFERLKLLRCDFSGARGLDEVELDNIDQDRVVGLEPGEEPPPGLPGDAPPAAPFRPQDSPGTLLFRALKPLPAVPLWMMDSPSLKPPALPAPSAGSGLEWHFREAVRAQWATGQAVSHPEVVTRAQAALRFASPEAAAAAVYLRQVKVEPLFRFSAARALKDRLRAEMATDDATASIDPKVAGALAFLRLPQDTAERWAEARRRLCAAQLFTALLEAGFTPAHDWAAALEAQDAAAELESGSGLDRAALAQAFEAFAALPDEARWRRLATLAESSLQLETLHRLPPDTEPAWVSGPEFRECCEREMSVVAFFGAEEVPARAAALAESELGIEAGTVPEESEEDLFIHLRCAGCGKEKLLLQSP